MKKKILTVLVLAMLVAALCACGKTVEEAPRAVMGDIDTYDMPNAAKELAQREFESMVYSAEFTEGFKLTLYGGGYLRAEISGEFLENAAFSDKNVNYEFTFFNDADSVNNMISFTYHPQSYFWYSPSEEDGVKDVCIMKEDGSIVYTSNAGTQEQSVESGENVPLRLVCEKHVDGGLEIIDELIFQIKKRDVIYNG